MAGWTRFILRHRRAVLVLWLAALLAGAAASTRLPALLSNSFAVPGTDSERVLQVLQSEFGDRSDGAFTVVFELDRTPGAPVAGTDARTLRAALRRAAAALPGGTLAPFHGVRAPAGNLVVYGDIDSTLTMARAQGYTDAIRRALGRPPGVSRVYLTGAAAIQHD